MFHHFEGETADEVWQKAAERFIGSEDTTVRAGRGGQTQELLHSTFAIYDPRQRWVMSRRPALNPAFAIVEVAWILAGRNDSAVLNFWNRRLPQYSGTGPTYHGAYGHRLRRHFGFDQLERAYQALQHNPDSRQVVLQLWDARVDLPSDLGEPANADIPCNIASFLKIRDEKLEWMQMMRSNDLFKGLPYNIAQFTVIQEVVAGWLGIEVGGYHHLSDSLHLYDEDATNLSLGNQVLAPNNDFLGLAKTDFEDVLQMFNRYVDYLSTLYLREKDFVASLASKELPMPYQNLLSVVTAESARRRGWIDRADEFMADCTNPALQLLWANWVKRLQIRQQGERAMTLEAG